MHGTIYNRQLLFTINTIKVGYKYTYRAISAVQRIEFRISEELLYKKYTASIITCITRRSVEHCTPHADGAWLNELGWSQ